MQVWVAKEICNLFNIEYSTDDDSLVYSRQASLNGVDVVINEPILSKFPYSIECKNQEKWNLNKTIEQAKSNTKDGTDWLVVLKRNYQKPVVEMDADNFFKLYQRTL